MGTTTILDKDLQPVDTWLALDWHKFTLIPVASGVTLRHDVMCETVRARTTVLYKFIYFM